MKKLFISCPMKGRTEENIRASMDKMHKLAELIFGEELEVIPSYIEDRPPDTNNQRIWYLAKSIELMAEADYLIGIRYCDMFDGCMIENEVAYRYGIKSFLIDAEDLMPAEYKTLCKSFVPGCGEGTIHSCGPLPVAK